MSASVDELRATVENFSLSPLGVTMVRSMDKFIRFCFFYF